MLSFDAHTVADNLKSLHTELLTVQVYTRLKQKLLYLLGFLFLGLNRQDTASVDARSGVTRRTREIQRTVVCQPAFEAVRAIFQTLAKQPLEELHPPFEVTARVVVQSHAQTPSFVNEPIQTNDI